MVVSYYDRATSHALSSFREGRDHEFFVIFSPSPHRSVRVDKRADIVVDIIPLTLFLVKGDATRWRCQRVEKGMYIVFGTTGNADGQIGMPRPNKILYEVKHLFSIRWGPSGARALI